jgi:hypothetical protein
MRDGSTYRSARRMHRMSRLKAARRHATENGQARPVLSDVPMPRYQKLQARDAQNRERNAEWRRRHNTEERAT